MRKLIAVVVIGLTACGTPAHFPAVQYESAPAAQAPAAPPPPPPHQYSADEIIARCKHHGVTCSIDFEEGRLALKAHFASQQAMDAVFKGIASDAAEPFCAQTNHNGYAARFYAHIVYARSRYYECRTGKVTDWVQDLPPDPIPPHVKTMEQICTYIEKDVNRPFHCRIVSYNEMVMLRLSSVVAFDTATPYFKDIDDNLTGPYCRIALNMGVGALIDVQFPLSQKGFRLNCENPNHTPKPYRLAPAQPQRQENPPAAPSRPSGDNRNVTSL
jgi:hypothetical protein